MSYRMDMEPIQAMKSPSTAADVASLAIRSAKHEPQIRSIEAEPNNPVRYTDLARALEDPKDQVSIRGVVYGQKQLYIKAIEVDPKYGPAYSDLAVVINHVAEESVVLQGRVYTE